MTIEIGEKVGTASSGNQSGDQGEKKGIKAFFKASDLKPDQVIEGMYKGTFESKKTKDYHFHIFEDKQGDVYAYGESLAINDVVKNIKDKQDALPNYLYASFKYEGKFPNKGNPKKTTHRFSGAELFATNVVKPVVTAKAEATAGEPSATVDEIPF